MNSLTKLTLLLLLTLFIFSCEDEPIVKGVCEDQYCSGYGDCAITNDKQAICVCVSGYHADGLSCIKDQENLCENQTCSNHGECFIESDTAKCNCNSGYHAEGLTCIENSLNCNVNQHEENRSCISNTKTVDCKDITPPENGKQVESQVEITWNNGWSEPANCDFKCDSEYHKVENSCIKNRVNECLDNNLNNCNENATCSDTPDSFTCECNEGFSGDGITCLDDSLCHSDCGDNAYCNNGDCKCLSGYEGDPNSECTSIDDCVGNSCVNGECVDGLNSYSCSCDAGYEGDYCQTNIDDCATNPCLNNGECIDGVNSYSCNCETGYSGDNCQTNIDDCISNSCVNGECIDGLNSYSCSCDAGYEGDYCQTNIDDCATNPCLNNGECIDGVNSYSCNCETGYSGDNCQIEIYQWGISSSDYGKVIRVDNLGNVYVASRTTRSMILTKFDSSFTQLWKKEWTAVSNYINDMEIDGDYIYLVGKYDYGSDNRAFLKKISLSSGDELFSRLFGDSGSVYTSAYALVIKNGDIYITGALMNGDIDSFVAKYDTTGTREWIEFLGGFSKEKGADIALDSNNNIYVTGWTKSNSFYPNSNGSGSDQDCFVVKYNSNRTIEWVKRFNTDTDDTTSSIVIDSNDNVYVAVKIEGRPFIKKMDSDNNILSSKRLNNAQEITSMIIDNNTLYMTGWTDEDNGGDFGGKEIILTKFSNNSFYSITQFGTTSDDIGNSVSINNGNLYITGETSGSFPNYQNQGSTDPFIIKTQVP